MEYSVTYSEYHFFTTAYSLHGEAGHVLAFLKTHVGLKAGPTRESIASNNYGEA